EGGERRLVGVTREAAEQLAVGHVGRVAPGHGSDHLAEHWGRTAGHDRPRSFSPLPFGGKGSGVRGNGHPRDEPIPPTPNPSPPRGEGNRMRYLRPCYVQRPGVCFTLSASPRGGR